MKKFLAVTFNSEIFSSTYKWTKFISASGHSNENKARRKFKRRKYFTAKKFLIYCIQGERASPTKSTSSLQRGALSRPLYSTFQAHESKLTVSVTHPPGEQGEGHCSSKVHVHVLPWRYSIYTTFVLSWHSKNHL